MYADAFWSMHNVLVHPVVLAGSRVIRRIAEARLLKRATEHLEEMIVLILS